MDMKRFCFADGVQTVFINCEERVTVKVDTQKDVVVKPRQWVCYLFYFLTFFPFFVFCLFVCLFVCL